MYQHSDPVTVCPNACVNAADSTVEASTDVEVAPSVAGFSELSLPAFWGRYIGDDAGDAESVDALGTSLAARVLGSGPEGAACGSASFSSDDDVRTASAEAAPFERIFASVMTPVESASASTATHAGSPEHIAHLLRIVGSVASREVMLDASHRPPEGGQEYDPRRLLVAAYTVLSDAARVTGNRRLSKSKFGRLVAGIQNNVFSNWTKQFEKHLNDANGFWVQLGLNDGSDACATIDRLEILSDANAPAPTLQDLIASPFYRMLSIIQRSSVSDAQRRAALRVRQACPSDATTSSAASRPLHPSGVTPLSRIATASQRVGDGGDARIVVQALADRHGVDAAILPFASESEGPGDPMAPVSEAASCLAHLLRILGSVARRDVIPDESHRPPPGAAEYDARSLLVAAYNALSARGHAAGSNGFAKSRFSRLAVGIQTNRFSDWTRQFANRLSTSTQFWAQLGFDEWRDAQATIDQLEALYDAGASSPTEQDLVESPFYRRLSFIKQSGVTDAERHKAKRARLASPGNRGSASAATCAVRASRATLPFDVSIPVQRAEALNDAHLNVGGGAAFGNTDRTHSTEGMPRPLSAVATVSRDGAAERIAALLRVLGSVANREIRFDESHRPPADGPVYDARCLLVAAYNILHIKGHAGGSHRFSKRHFNRLAVRVNSGLFNLWTLRLEGHLGAAIALWAQLGLDDVTDAQATIDRLEALQRAGAPTPTVQDLVASPLYRKLAFNGQNRMGGESLKSAKRSTVDNASRIAPSIVMIDDASENVPWSQVPVSFDALDASTLSRPDPVSPIPVARAADRGPRQCVSGRSAGDEEAGASACSLRSSLLTPPPRSSASPDGHIGRYG